MCGMCAKLRVLVVGAGRAGAPATCIAQAFAREGASLAVTARSKGALQTVHMLEGQGAGRVVGLVADGADADAAARCVQQAEEALDGLDVVVVAGMASVAGVPLARLKPSQLETAWRTGPASVFNWLASAHDALARTQGHAVVCLPPDRCARVAGAAVSSAVAATRALCESACDEWAGEGIACDVVDLFAETPALARLAEENEEAFSEFAARAVASLEDPDRLAARILALVSSS